MSSWNRCPCSSLTDTISFSKKSKWESKKYTFKDILQSVTLQDCTRSATITRQFSALWFPTPFKKIVVIFMNDFQAALPTPRSWSSNFTSCIHSLIWSSTNTLSVVSASLILGNLIFQIHKYSASLIHYLDEIFISLSLMCNGGKLPFSGLVNGVFTTFWCPGISGSHLGHSS